MNTTNSGNDQHWRDRALCREVDAEIFFPEKGGPSHTAQRVCASCEVRVDCCLADALSRRDVGFGVLGGLTPRQRRELLHQPAGTGAARMGRAAADLITLGELMCPRLR